MFCLSKGLGAPVGSVLCGPARRDRRRRARTGRGSAAGCARPGVIAAAGVVALETMVERLADDHARARRLADALADALPGQRRSRDGRAPTSCAPAPTRFPTDFVDALAERRGAARAPSTRDTVRFVTHKDVDDDGDRRARSPSCVGSS